MRRRAECTKTDGKLFEIYKLNRTLTAYLAAFIWRRESMMSPVYAALRKHRTGGER